MKVRKVLKEFNQFDDFGTEQEYAGYGSADPFGDAAIDRADPAREYQPDPEAGGEEYTDTETYGQVSSQPEQGQAEWDQLSPEDKMAFTQWLITRDAVDVEPEMKQISAEPGHAYAGPVIHHDEHSFKIKHDGEVSTHNKADFHPQELWMLHHMDGENDRFGVRYDDRGRGQVMDTYKHHYNKKFENQ